MYGNYIKTSKNIFLKNNNISEDGLSSEEVIEKRKIFGYNSLKNAKEKKWYHFFLKSLFSPFNSILLGIATVLIYTDIFLTTPSYSNIIVILILVLVSSILEFFSEYRSNKAASKLRSLVATEALVLRNNEKINIPIRELVVGDIIFLSAGDMIPADLRVLEAKDLYLSQSSLTGESETVKKVANSENKFKEDYDITDIDNLCFMGTNVVSGSGKCSVIKLAKDSYFGKIAQTLDMRKT